MATKRQRKTVWVHDEETTRMQVVYETLAEMVCEGECVLSNTEMMRNLARKLNVPYLLVELAYYSSNKQSGVKLADVDEYMASMPARVACRSAEERKGGK